MDLSLYDGYASLFISEGYKTILFSKIITRLDDIKETYISVQCWLWQLSETAFMMRWAVSANSPLRLKMKKGGHPT